MVCARSLFIHVTGPFAMDIAGHQAWSPSLQSLQRDTVLSTAHFLSQELDPLGIKVSMVSIGPSAPAKASRITHVEARCVFCPGCRNLVTNAAVATALHPARLATSVLQVRRPASMFLSPCVSSRIAGYFWSIPLPETIEGVLSHFAVDHEEVWRTVQNIIRSP